MTMGIDLSSPDTLLALPILIPMVGGGLTLLAGESERTRAWRPLISVSSVLASLVVAGLLLWQLIAGPLPVLVSSPGNWPVPYGIVLVADPLAGWMLMLTAIVVLCSLLQSLARWHRAGVHFHPLLQFQLMGLNGVFLTGDLFNFFVFLEVLLASSYGLLLHGSGSQRIQSGLHYVAVNLLSSSLLLIAIAMLYSVSGSLNLADMADRISYTPPGDRGILQAGVALLGVAMLIKAGAWPLNFWLVPAYSAASSPVAGIFVLLTKVGVYALLRIWMLLFSSEAAMAPRFGADVVLWAGLATLLFGSVGMLASYRLSRLAAFSVIVSAGTLMAAIGVGGDSLVASALFYLTGSTLAASAMFLLVELLERVRGPESAHRASIDDFVGRTSYFAVKVPRRDAMTSDAMTSDAPETDSPEAGIPDPDAEAGGVGRIITRPYMWLGFGFLVCTMMLAGMPPLAGFTAKVGLIVPLLDHHLINGEPWAPAMLLVGALLLSGLCTLVAMTRAGIRCLWARNSSEIPQMSRLEYAPIALLCMLIVIMTSQSPAMLAWTGDMARRINTPAVYVDAVRNWIPQGRASRHETQDGGQAADGPGGPAESRPDGATDAPPDKPTERRPSRRAVKPEASP